MIVRWTKCAALDMVNIRDYKARESPAYADEFTDRVFERLEQISAFPDSGQIVLEYGRDDINEILVFSFRVIYQILDDHVRVLTVIHGANPLSPDPPASENAE